MVVVFVYSNCLVRQCSNNPLFNDRRIKMIRIREEIIIVSQQISTRWSALTTI